jgi:hypothetical protein
MNWLKMLLAPREAPPACSIVRFHVVSLVGSTTENTLRTLCCLFYFLASDHTSFTQEQKPNIGRMGEELKVRTFKYIGGTHGRKIPFLPKHRHLTLEGWEKN